MKRINELENIHQGKTCYIVGTGPSAATLTKEDFQDGFVIAVNSAIRLIERLDLDIPVYGQYKDGNYPEEQCSVKTCRTCIKGQSYPTKCTLLLHVHHAANCFEEYEPKYFFDNLDYGLKVIDFSQMSAIRNAELMGACSLVFYGFDSITTGDCSKFSGVGYPTAYAKQAEIMKNFDYRLPYTYATIARNLEPEPQIDSTIDLVYVLGTGSKWSDNEIRFSLRSVEKYLKGFRNIYVVGECPAFLQNVIHIPATDEFDPAVNADGNMILKILKACALPDLSDDFLFMNDDFVFMKPVVASEIKWMYKGDMKDRPESFWKEQFYRHRLRRTYETLRDLGETTLQYDYHAPMRMNKHSFREVMEHFDFTEGIGLTFRSLYGNVMKLPAERLTDQKRTVYKHYRLGELQEYLNPATFLGYNDMGLSKTLKHFLISIFPDKSSFENTDISDRVIEISKWLNGDRNYTEGVELFARYMHGANLLKMFRAGETPGLRKKLEFKLERVFDEIR